jgi:hypothetical protein
MAEADTFMIEDAEILFRNFEGREEMFNIKGQRNFAVILPQELANQLIEDGWNVRELEAREEGDEPKPYLSVAVSYKYKPPHVVMITSNARTRLNEDSIETLDFADLAKVDLVCNAYDWTMPSTGKSGRKAYLKTMFATIAEDELQRKYAATEDLGYEEGLTTN